MGVSSGWREHSAVMLKPQEAKVVQTRATDKRLMNVQEYSNSKRVEVSRLKGAECYGSVWQVKI